jgi:hypothetical protein
MDNVLTAIFCSAVSLVAGVLLARIFPDHLNVEWGNLAEWVTGLAALATAAIAWMALRSWRDQASGMSKHKAAAKIAEAALLMKYHFYDARNPMYDPVEFPAAYNLQKPASRGPLEKARGWAHAYDGRYRRLNRQILRLATLRAKAGALLSEECAAHLEALARKARLLREYFGHSVAQIKAGGEVVKQWDQKWVERVKQSITANPMDHSDPYSLEFEATYDAFMDCLKPFLL